MNNRNTLYGGLAIAGWALVALLAIFPPPQTLGDAIRYQALVNLVNTVRAAL